MAGNAARVRYSIGFGDTIGVGPIQIIFECPVTFIVGECPQPVTPLGKPMLKVCRSRYDQRTKKEQSEEIPGSGDHASDIGQKRIQGQGGEGRGEGGGELGLFYARKPWFAPWCLVSLFFPSLRTIEGAVPNLHARYPVAFEGLFVLGARGATLLRLLPTDRQ